MLKKNNEIEKRLRDSPPPSISPYLSLAHRESVLWNLYHSHKYHPLQPTKNPYYETPTMVAACTAVL